MCMGCPGMKMPQKTIGHSGMSNATPRFSAKNPYKPNMSSRPAPKPVSAVRNFGQPAIKSTYFKIGR